MDIKRFESFRDAVLEPVCSVIVGKREVAQLVLTCFVCSGHVLLEDVPGTGKTMMLRAFSKVLGGKFSRIQFTPDLLPSDLTGIDFYNQKTGEFEFRPGPLFANIVLADEINRATPRTQSSLLEAMEERQISVDGKTYPLEEPFMVMATQNPLESYGTFPLPEAQTDRFFMRLHMGYPDRQEELELIGRPSTAHMINSLQATVTPEDIAYVRENYTQVKFSPVVSGYLMDLVEKTRQDSGFSVGVSTRGAIALYKAAQVTAAFHGRDFVIPEDVKDMAPHVLGHRLSSSSLASSRDVQTYLQKLIAAVPVPTENL
ncbi:MoxR family ATPase [Intestinimonas sp. MSJ-38]|uniref:AAA family ATPase n=1 Tax=Intestinimonas sp. MSJ-38 TaxID=2841532 RepID=UPI001C105B9F|nr:MoxR family ATPase [Intestinimonas sp. MSJ-38]